MRELIARLSESGTTLHALRQFNLNQKKEGKPRSVKELAEELGLAVMEVDLPKGLSGYLDADPLAPNGYCILVNKNESVTSRRWTVLHELGHYFLHRERANPFASSQFLDRSAAAFYGNPKEEKEANDFAATMLFGDGALKAAVGIYGRDVKRLSKVFGVSERTIDIGLSQFGI